MNINIPYKYKFYGYHFMAGIVVILFISNMVYSSIQLNTLKKQYTTVFLEMTNNLSKQDMPNLHTVGNVYKNDELKKLLVSLDIYSEQNLRNLEKLRTLINQIGKFEDKNNKYELKKIYDSYVAILTIRDLTKKYNQADSISNEYIIKDRKTLMDAYSIIYSFRSSHVLRN